MHCLALDIGGANLKAADGRGYAASRSFPLWRKSPQLAGALQESITAAPACDRLFVTMTGELADCYRTKAEGVGQILQAVSAAAGARPTRVYRTDGRFESVEAALREPLCVAASNWHALACFACRYVSHGAGLLVDIGSTTTDIVPLTSDQPLPQGRTDPQRLLCGELVYTGVERSPVCALVSALPWRGRQLCPTAHEVFATTCDAYLTLGDLAEDRSATQTADGRAMTKDYARDRLARSICADREMFDPADALRAAQAIRRAQLAKLLAAANDVMARLPTPPATVIVCGRGEFLARALTDQFAQSVDIVSLADRLGPEVSRAATAHALAVLAREANLP